MKLNTLARGSSAWIYPVTRVVSKHLRPIHDKIAIFHRLTGLILGHIEFLPEKSGPGVGGGTKPPNIIHKTESLAGRSFEFSLFLSVILALTILHLILLVSEFGFQFLSSIGDGPEYLQFAASLLSGSYPYIHFPLYPAIIRVISVVIRPPEAAILWSTTAYVLAACVFWKISTHPSVASGKSLIPLFVSLVPPTLLIYSTAPVADTTAIFLGALTYYFMLGCREKSLILSSMAAVATHYLALLIWPAVFYYFARKGLREIPKAFLTILPFLLLSLYQYLVRGDPLYYIHGYVHTSYWTARGGFLSYPFATVPYVLENYGRFSLLLLVSTFTLYIFALFMSIKRRDLQSAVFSAPFVVFIIFLGPTGFFFVPRYAEFAFPSLFSFGRLTNNRIVRIFLFLVVLLSVAYSFFRGLSPPA